MASAPEEAPLPGPLGRHPAAGGLAPHLPREGEGLRECLGSLALWGECGHPWRFLALALETQAGRRCPRCAFFQLLGSCVVSTCCVPGTVAGAGGVVESQTDTMPASGERGCPRGWNSRCEDAPRHQQRPFLVPSSAFRELSLSHAGSPLLPTAAWAAGGKNSCCGPR